MGKNVEVRLSPQLWRWLDLLEESFDLLPAEILRIAEIDPLKTCTLLSRQSETKTRKIHVPAGLWGSLKEKAHNLRSPVSDLVEQMLRQMIMQVVSTNTLTLREDAKAMKKLREEVEAASW
ncbi:hypothetical protein [Geoalkalibacter subterraneus]|uniref:Uncharacterized protein n=1 Tax=Geoalkalibacter subterraneus TaxID=483547 RepID=A0A0B5FJD1_9BACT|nr:hypothetical protein [Geoalkalibacter subterraneus]AJF08277.1 hypothetical protein GSUB_17525 [Geoalkalibacter subterraneus]